MKCRINLLRFIRLDSFLVVEVKSYLHYAQQAYIQWFIEEVWRWR